MKKTNESTKPWKIKPEKKKKPASKLGRILKYILIAAGVAILCVGAYLAVNIFFRKPDQNGVQKDDEDIRKFLESTDMFASNESGKNAERVKGFYNILVIGRDKVALNTDSIIIVGFDTENNKASTVQIPRDSFVEDENGYQSRINAVLARGYTEAQSELTRLRGAVSSGGNADTLTHDSFLSVTPEKLSKSASDAKLRDKICMDHGVKKLQKVISKTFGIFFDYYAVISTDAFCNIVDAVGGVDITVPQRMDYDDPLQDLHIHFAPGPQHMTGKQAEGFVRFRSGYANADIGRMDAQKIFLTALFKKVVSIGSVTKINNIVKAVFDSLDTDMSLENALGFVQPALSVDLSSITMMNMQGGGYQNPSTGAWYFALDKTANLEIVNKYFNVFDTDITENAVSVVLLGNANSQSSGVSVTTGDKVAQGGTKPVEYTKPSSGKTQNTTPKTPSSGKPATVKETPEKAEKTEKAEKAESPETPENTEDPENVGGSEQQEDPENPENVENPESPENAEDPDEKAIPAISENPENPDDPENSEKTDENAGGINAEGPGNSGTAEKTENPVNPVNPENTEKTEAPAAELPSQEVMAGSGGSENA